MSDQELCIYFCTDDAIDKSDPVQWLRDWVSPADVQITAAPGNALTGTGGLPYLAVVFNGMAGEAHVIDNESQNLRSLLFKFPYNGFLRRIMDDELDGILHTFRDVCNERWPRVAFLDALSSMDAKAAVRAASSEALMFSGTDLVQEEVPVVYLDSVLLHNLPPDMHPSPRPDLQVENGAIFLGERLFRWLD